MRHFATYAIGAVFIRGISFLIVPIIMRVISPQEYGILALLTTFTAIVTTLIGLGLRQVVSIEYFHLHAQDRGWLIQDIVVIYTIIAIPITFLFWYLRSFLIHSLFFDTVTSTQLMAILLPTFFYFYSELLYQLLQYQQKAKYLTLLQCSIAITVGIMSLIAVFYMGAGINGILWSQAIGTILAATISLTYLLGYQLPLEAVHRRLAHAPYYLRYGFPFIPGLLASWIMASVDRWILGYYGTMRDVGIYAVADLASQLFYFIILQPWAGSYLPYIMHRYQQNPSQLATIERENHRTMWLTMGGIAVAIAVGYPIGSLIAAHLLPSNYRESLHYAWILLMGQLFLLGSYFVAALIQYKKRTYFLTGALCSAAGVNIFLNFIFIPQWGIMGCSIATWISYAFYFIIIYHYNKKLMTCVYEGE